MGALQPEHSTRHNENANEQHRHPPQEIVLIGSHLRNERAQQQSHEQAADVRRVIDATDHCPKEEVVADKRNDASLQSADRSAWQREFA